MFKCRKSFFFLIAIIILLFFLTVTFLLPNPTSSLHDFTASLQEKPPTISLSNPFAITVEKPKTMEERLIFLQKEIQELLFVKRKATAQSNTIMPKMANQTVKEELGRSTWRLLHTMAARFPINPRQNEVVAFELFVLLLSRLYPCGECAEHFQSLLQKKPLALQSRALSVQWFCEAHNEVNKRLHKEQFDCSKALETWDCGCSDGLE